MDERFFYLNLWESEKEADIVEEKLSVYVVPESELTLMFRKEGEIEIFSHPALEEKGLLLYVMATCEEECRRGHLVTKGGCVDLMIEHGATDYQILSVISIPGLATLGKEEKCDDAE